MKAFYQTSPFLYLSGIVTSSHQNTFL